MTSNEHGLRSLADQRYYHFIALRNKGDLTLSAYWRKVGDVLAPINSGAAQFGNQTIQHRKFRSAKAFARGNVAEMLSEKGKGQPPYLYDVFAIDAAVGGNSYLLLGFPFASLALEIVQDLIERQNLLKAGELVGVNVPKLVVSMEKKLDSRPANFQIHVVGVQFVVTDDKSLTAVRLGGDDPLSAQIYGEFLQSKVSDGLFLPDQCTLACQRAMRDAEAGSFRGSRSRLHVDGYGNFKFYAHVGCSNLDLIQDALDQLRRIGCLQKVSGNPLRKLDRDESE